jgi:hypothetical protein
MRSLRGKTVLITGATRRIGRATALALVDAGASIVAHFHSSEREASELVREVLARGGLCWSVRADLASEPDVESLVKWSSAVAGRPIDALVNNASIFPSDTFETVTRDEMIRSFTVNAWAPFALGRAFAKQTGEGHIVNLLDEKIGGYRLAHVAYQASKQTLAALTRLMALELAPGIAVNAVAPGLVLPPPGKDEAWLERQARSSVPMAKPGGPADVAEAIVYLLGSRYLSGQVIYVDGGAHLLEPTDGPHSH